MIEIITKKEQWNAELTTIGHSDFYHTYYYHCLSKQKDENPILVKYSKDNLVILLPLLIRKIEDTPYFDATSVYGYAGPLFNCDKIEFDNKVFKIELLHFLNENKVISVFSRLHPYIEYQEYILKDIGSLIHHNDVVNIDLTEPLDIQRQKYSSRLKTYINKARRECTVRKGVSEKDTQTFIEMYYENMTRVNASSNYYFSERYFYQLMLGCHFETELLLVEYNETKEIIGGAIFVKTDDIVEYHLAGVRDKYLQHNPLKLLIDEMRIRATVERYNYFNLGGGKSSMQDSLFNFKASFSKNLRPFKLWKLIVNQDIYDDLVKTEKDKVKHEINEDYSDYFPLYRYFLQIGK